MRLLVLAAAAAGHAAAEVVVDTVAMWAELDAHCAAGKCVTHEGSKLHQLANTTDCAGRMLAYEYGLTLIPSRKPQVGQLWPSPFDPVWLRSFPTPFSLFERQPPLALRLGSRGAAAECVPRASSSLSTRSDCRKPAA